MMGQASKTEFAKNQSGEDKEIYSTSVIFTALPTILFFSFYNI